MRKMLVLLALSVCFVGSVNAQYTDEWWSLNVHDDLLTEINMSPAPYNVWVNCVYERQQDYNELVSASTEVTDWNGYFDAFWDAMHGTSTEPGAEDYIDDMEYYYDLFEEAYESAMAKELVWQYLHYDIYDYVSARDAAEDGIPFAEAANGYYYDNIVPNQLDADGKLDQAAFILSIVSP